MNDINGICQIYGDTQTTKLEIGTWSKRQQKSFIKSLYKFKGPEPGCCLCCFDVEYNNTRLFDIGLYNGVVYASNNWLDEFKNAKKNDFAIIMNPFIQRGTMTLTKDSYCKCGITSAHQCPKYIKDGKCTAPTIQELVGKVLFPNKYGKQR